jgi:hypothetical protein
MPATIAGLEACGRALTQYVAAAKALERVTK